MTSVIVHAKVLPGADDGDPNTASPTDWNADHIVAGLPVLLATLTAPGGSGIASLDFATRNGPGQSGALFQSDFDHYQIEFVKLVPINNGTALCMQVGTGGGPTYDSTSGHYTWVGLLGVPGATGNNGSTSDTSIHFNGNGSASNVASRGGVAGSLMLFDPMSATDEKLVIGTFFNRVTTNSDQPGVWMSGGTYNQITALTAVKFFYSSGNIFTGSIRISGRP